MRAAFYTLGCKVNQNETGALQALFAAAGYEIVSSDAEADVYVVNSCTVTAGGDAKSRQWLRRARRQSPAAVTVLTGCFPQAFPQDAAISEADVVTGTANRTRLVENVARYLATGQQVVDIAPHQKGEAFEKLPARPQAGRTRAFVKIQDGCNRRCAYCIIPTARGPVRSRPEADILEELSGLVAQGYREVVFTGINLPSYGQDTGTGLADLLDAAAKIEGLARLRLSSLDPDLVTPGTIARFAANQKLCHSFHLSLQSGSSATLRAMRRPYTAQGYREAAEALRAAMPDAMLTTDVIVGFPGETEADFAESLAFVTEMRFLKVHVFPFSARPGTPAAGFPNQLPKAEKQRRAKAMQAAADAVRGELLRELVGSRQQVLLEKPQADGRFTGYTAGYVPVLAHAPGAVQGEIVDVNLTGTGEEHCEAEILR